MTQEASTWTVPLLAGASLVSSIVTANLFLSTAAERPSKAMSLTIETFGQSRHNSHSLLSKNTAVVLCVLSLVIFYVIQWALTIRRGFSRPALILAALVWMPPMVTLAEYVLVFMPITYSALVLPSVGFQWISGEL
ncbi:hypothetical protein H634G_05665 [Metarhizium anisopliae BRIP 53293]|uniref:Uncharacterized protein n=1 Tax=Metarhizium anisopliae BRIP 53293 TaxID=1291518 RepID=A0A0D9NYD2_METAN|nr:hypothetical protein H634G_05665 [Metarhizium anisopliae BRIP 53293]KJK86690.1 hypothetical protein H633G_09448 [Metarhizium anisopliae BRIP 53284]